METAMKDIGAARMLRIRATQPEGRYRCGRRWTPEGVLVEQGELEEAQWAAIAADPLLKVEPVEASEATEAVETEAAAALASAFAQLAPEEFDAAGKPKLDALRALLPGVKISAALRDQAWAAAQAK
ncbi:hypothetical protein [Cereibacter changlensis]|nr:hypothetical protein [Cereibacter changlensis]